MPLFRQPNISSTQKKQDQQKKKININKETHSRIKDKTYFMLARQSSTVLISRVFLSALGMSLRRAETSSNDGFSDSCTGWMQVELQRALVVLRTASVCSGRSVNSQHELPLYIVGLLPV